MEFEFIPVPTGETHPLDAIIPLIGDENALVGPSGDDMLLMEYNGEEYRIPADLDAESATLTDGRGMNILADTDGDGRVDYVSTVDYNGSWSAWRWQGGTVAISSAGDGSAKVDSVEVDSVGAIEQQKLHSVPENTPEQGGRNWDKGAWKCVERGEWG